jgi:hypothetical protein
MCCSGLLPDASVGMGKGCEHTHATPMRALHSQLTGPAFTLNGLLAMYLLSAHSLCTRKSVLAKLPTSIPSPGDIKLRPRAPGSMNKALCLAISFRCNRVDAKGSQDSSYGQCRP